MRPRFWPLFSSGILPQTSLKKGLIQTLQELIAKSYPNVPPVEKITADLGKAGFPDARRTLARTFRAGITQTLDLDKQASKLK